MPSEVLDLARRIAEAAADKQASDVVLLDMRKVCSFADYFIICSGESERQIQAIDDAVAEVIEVHHRLAEMVGPLVCRGDCAFQP